jgi:hypothetical protein
MKLNVPDILVKFFRKHDPAAHLHEIHTDDLPLIGTHYRDNTTGIIWEVAAYSGGDTYEEPNSDPFYAYGLNREKLGKPEPDRLVILKSVEPEGVMMHVAPKVLTSTIHSMEHYAVVQKAMTEIARFELVENYSDGSAPFWKRRVKVMDTDKTLRKLAESDTTSLYLLNIYATQHGLADLFLEYIDPMSSTKKPFLARIGATWIPQDILQQVPSKSVLLEHREFRRYLDNGFIQPITTGSAKLIMQTAEYKAEIERLKEADPITYNHALRII